MKFSFFSFLLGVENEITFDQKPTFVSEDVFATGYLDVEDNNNNNNNNNNNSRGHFNNKRAASDGETRMMFPPFPAGKAIYIYI